MQILRREMPELDTLRGIAVLLVVFFHGFGFLVGPYNLGIFHGVAKYFVAVTWTGWMGVNLFFVLSGFLITGILLDSTNRSDYFRRFYLRRALRILPAYYLILLALPILSLIPDFPRHVGWPFVGLAFVYCANIVNLFSVPMQYGPLWSLAVEEHFYLFWPAVVRKFAGRTLVAVCVLLVLASPILRLCTPSLSGATWQNLDGLSMGALFAVLARRTPRPALKWLAGGCVLAAVAGFAVGFPFGIHLISTWVGKAFRNSIIDLFFLGVLITFLLVGTSRFSRYVNIGWLKFFGYISYGLYLVHMLAFDFYDAWRGPAIIRFGPLALRFSISLAAATLFCWIMRITFEEYFLRMKERLFVARKQEAVTTEAVFG